MGLRDLTRTAAASASLALALGAVPAFAQDGPHDPPPPEGQMQMGGPAAGYSMALEAREAWLAECRHRSHYRAKDRDQCEAYLDDYYSYYRNYYAHGYPGAGYGYPGSCCQPMMMVPIVRMPRGEPECKETVEYEYVDVPVQAKPRPAPRPVPDKRVKIVPDKRIPVK